MGQAVGLWNWVSSLVVWPDLLRTSIEPVDPIRQTGTYPNFYSAEGEIGLIKNF